MPSLLTRGPDVKHRCARSERALETTGRRTGAGAAHPVCDGLDGQTFWLIAQSGRHADWIQNIEADPRVRVKVASWPRTHWRTGTAHVLDDDDPRERQAIIGRSNLARRLCVGASAAVAPARSQSALTWISIDAHRWRGAILATG